MKPGTLYGVSVGPGDPALLTMQAARAIAACPVIAAPRTGDGKTLALDIAAGAVDLSGKQIVYLDFVMTRDTLTLERQHRALGERLRALLDQDRDVAVLNIGDVSIYSTFSYLAEQLAPLGYPVRWLPGVPSFCAAACALGRSLTEAGKPLHIYPGSGDLGQALSADGGKVLMKSGKRLPQTLEAIEAAGLAPKAALAANCGMENEKLCPDIAQADGLEGYFTTVLIRP